VSIKPRLRIDFGNGLVTDEVEGGMGHEHTLLQIQASNLGATPPFA
jgi:hypothetical protein